MRNRLVPRTEWFRFFEEFSRRYDGWLATVRVLASQLRLASGGARPASRGDRVVGRRLGSDFPPSRGLDDKNVEHEIPSPRQVWVEMSEARVEEAVGVLSEDGTKTILEFRSPALPETVDGIVHP